MYATRTSEVIHVPLEDIGINLCMYVVCQISDAATLLSALQHLGKGSPSRWCLLLHLIAGADLQQLAFINRSVGMNRANKMKGSNQQIYI